VEPVLVRAGFAAGQWTIDDAGVIFCAAAGEYIRRHPDLVDGSPHWGDAHCIDITIEGTVDGGITRFDVEFEPLADLLTRTGRGPDTAALPSLFRLDRPDEDLQRLGETVARLYDSPPAAGAPD
jgi:hypothetical protein